MILTRPSTLLLLLSTFLTILTLALNPNLNPNPNIHLPPPPLAPSNLANLTKPHPNPNPTPPPTTPIHCISTPRLRAINEYICAVTLHGIVHDPTSERRKHITLPVTEYGDPDGPCAIELRRGERGTGIWISDRVVAGAAVAVLRECAVSGGSGWAIMEERQSWYVLVYGERKGGGEGRLVRGGGRVS